jgi:uroporphyrin-3 C-methyltransferase
MNDSSATPSPAPPVAPPARGSRLPVFLAGVAMLLAAAALAIGLMLWQKFGAARQELVRRSQDTLTKAIETRALAEQSSALVESLQARLSVAEVRLSEVSLQRSQLEELMLSVSRSRDDNLVQDLESSIRLAQQQTQLTGSLQPLLSALQAADQRIARAAQPRLNPVQRAIARDIERLQGAAMADLPSMAQRLDELLRQVDDWPLSNQLGPAPAGREAPAEAAEGGAPTQTAGGDGHAGEAWWRRVWSGVLRQGRELVRIHHIEHPDAMLLAPDQAYFLRENMKLKLLNARLALLARQQAVILVDLQGLEEALQRYFDATAPGVKAALQSVRELRQQVGSLEVPRPDESLAALAVAAEGR